MLLKVGLGFALMISVSAHAMGLRPKRTITKKSQVAIRSKRKKEAAPEVLSQAEHSTVVPQTISNILCAIQMQYIKTAEICDRLEGLEARMSTMELLLIENQLTHLNTAEQLSPSDTFALLQEGDENLSQDDHAVLKYLNESTSE